MSIELGGHGPMNFGVPGRMRVYAAATALAGYRTMRLLLVMSKSRVVSSRDLYVLVHIVYSISLPCLSPTSLRSVALDL